MMTLGQVTDSLLLLNTLYSLCLQPQEDAKSALNWSLIWCFSVMHIYKKNSGSKCENPWACVFCCEKKQNSQSFRGHWIAFTLIVWVIHSPHKSRHAPPPYIICIYKHRWYWLCTNLVSHTADLNPCLCFWTHFCCFQVAHVWTVMPLSLCRGRCKI